MEKKKNLLYCLSNPFKTPGLLKLEKGEQNGRCVVGVETNSQLQLTVAGRLKDSYLIH